MKSILIRILLFIIKSIFSIVRKLHDYIIIFFEPVIQLLKLSRTQYTQGITIRERRVDETSPLNYCQCHGSS